jgi:predicted transposase YdaD
LEEVGVTAVLLGLRYSSELSAQLFRGVVSMKESSTYQAIVEEGRAEGIARGKAEGAIAEAKKVLRLQGEQAFGAPDAATLAAIERLNDLERLEDLLKRVRTADGWADLAGRPAAARKGGRRPSP